MCGGTRADQLLQNILKLLTKEYGDNCRRCLVSSETFIVSNVCCRLSQKICMLINGFQDTGENKKELDILMRSFSRLKKVDPVIRCQGPVVVLTGTVNSCKRFLMKQAAHTMAACNFFEDTHHDLVVICCNIYRCVDRCQLMLCRCNLIVLCLCCYAQLPALLVDFLHVCGDSLTDGSEIVVIHLLSLRRHSTEKSSSCVDQVFSLEPFLLVDQEIFLLSSNGRRYFFGSCISEKAEKSKCLCIDRFHGTKKRCFLIKCLSCVGAECCRDT